MTAPPRTDIRELTGIRALAAWWVVLFHARFQFAPHLPPWLEAVAVAGHWGVDVFFVLSGFVIYLNYARRIGDGGPAAAAAFLKRRLARIYPLHLAVLGMTVLYALAAYAFAGAVTTSYDFAYLPAHVLLVQVWGVDPNLRWNVPAWSISTEAAAYLIFPLFVWSARPERWPSFALVLGVGSLVGLLWLAFLLLGVPAIGDAIPRTGLVRCMLEFIAGALLCELYLRLNGAGLRAAARWSAAALAAAVAAGIVGAPDTIVVPAAAAATVLLVAARGGRGGPLSSAFLVYLGDISYSTYLSHHLLLVLFGAAFLPDAAATLTPAALVAYFVVVAAASVVLYHRVERPGQRLMLDRLGLPARRVQEAAAP